MHGGRGGAGTRGQAARNKEPSGNRHNTGLRRRAIPSQIPAATGDRRPTSYTRAIHDTRFVNLIRMRNQRYTAHLAPCLSTDTSTNITHTLQPPRLCVLANHYLSDSDQTWQKIANIDLARCYTRNFCRYDTNIDKVQCCTVRTCRHMYCVNAGILYIFPTRIDERLLGILNLLSVKLICM